ALAQLPNERPARPDVFDERRHEICETRFRRGRVRPSGAARKAHVWAGSPRTLLHGRLFGSAHVRARRDPPDGLSRQCDCYAPAGRRSFLHAVFTWHPVMGRGIPAGTTVAGTHSSAAPFVTFLNGLLTTSMSPAVRIDAAGAFRYRITPAT